METSLPDELTRDNLDLEELKPEINFFREWQIGEIILTAFFFFPFFFFPAEKLKAIAKKKLYT